MCILNGGSVSLLQIYNNYENVDSVWFIHYNSVMEKAKTIDLGKKYSTLHGMKHSFVEFYIL